MGFRSHISALDDIRQAVTTGGEAVALCGASHKPRPARWWNPTCQTCARRFREIDGAVLFRFMLGGQP